MIDWFTQYWIEICILIYSLADINIYGAIIFMR